MWYSTCNSGINFKFRIVSIILKLNRKYFSRHKKFKMGYYSLSYDGATRGPSKAIEKQTLSPI